MDFVDFHQAPCYSAFAQLPRVMRNAVIIILDTPVENWVPHEIQQDSHIDAF